MIVGSDLPHARFVEVNAESLRRQALEERMGRRLDRLVGMTWRSMRLLQLNRLKERPAG